MTKDTVILTETPACCPECGADQPSITDTCWLCGAEMSADVRDTQPIAPVQAAPQRFSFSLSTLLLLMTLASVCFGLLAVAPGLGIPMCVLLVPVLVRTAMVVRRREAAGRPVSRAEKVSLAISSFGVATVLAVVVSAAAFAGFCGACLLTFTPGKEYDLWGIGMFAAASLGLWGVITILKWIRRRYRRDVGE